MCHSWQHTYISFNMCGFVLQHCACVVTTDNWVAGMGSWLLHISYYKQTPHGLSAHMKFIQLNKHFLQSMHHWRIQSSFVNKYPLSAVPCKRTMYSRVVNFQITSMVGYKLHTDTFILLRWGLVYIKKESQHSKWQLLVFQNLHAVQNTVSAHKI
jgi:hypothetical protein